MDKTKIVFLMLFLILPSFALRTEWVKIKDEGLMSYIDLEPEVPADGMVRFKVTLNPLFIKEYELYSTGLVSKTDVKYEDWLSVSANKILLPITASLTKEDVVILDKTMDKILNAGYIDVIYNPETKPLIHFGWESEEWILVYYEDVTIGLCDSGNWSQYSNCTHSGNWTVQENQVYANVTSNETFWFLNGTAPIYPLFQIWTNIHTEAYNITFEIPLTVNQEYNISNGDITSYPLYNRSLDTFNCGLYRKNISITESSGITLINSTFLFNITYSEDMNETFSTLRFVNSNNKPLDYWIESYVESEYALVWIEVDTIKANDNTIIYVCYGNQSLETESNGENTFIWFDDATTDKSASYSCGLSSSLSYEGINNRYKISASGSNGGGCTPTDVLNSSSTYLISSDIYVVAPDSNEQVGIAWGDTTKSLWTCLSRSANYYSGYYQLYPDGAIVQNQPWLLNAWLNNTLKITNNYQKATWHGTSDANQETSKALTNNHIGMWVGAASGDYGYFRNFIIRKSAITEPTYVIGEQENSILTNFTFKIDWTTGWAYCTNHSDCTIPYYCSLTDDKNSKCTLDIEADLELENLQGVYPEGETTFYASYENEGVDIVGANVWFELYNASINGTLLGNNSANYSSGLYHASFNLTEFEGYYIEVHSEYQPIYTSETDTGTFDSVIAQLIIEYPLSTDEVSAKTLYPQFRVIISDFVRTAECQYETALQNSDKFTVSNNVTYSGTFINPINSENYLIVTCQIGEITLIEQSYYTALVVPDIYLLGINTEAHLLSQLYIFYFKEFLWTVGKPIFYFFSVLGFIVFVFDKLFIRGADYISGRRNK